MYYNECKYCGCSLDPGEKCDCSGAVEAVRMITYTRSDNSDTKKEPAA